MQYQIAVDPGIVEPILGADDKPVYTTSRPFTTTTHGRLLFDQWYRDVDGVNQRSDFAITLTNTAANPNIFTYDNQSFFPIDNPLFGNEGRAHNQHFTFEVHRTFTFHPDQQFTFVGDDDVWVFINDKLVIDLGGVHKALTGTVDLNTLGLTDGNSYEFDFFFAERNTFESHFHIDTTIADLGSGEEPPPPPTGVPLPAAFIPGLIVLGGLGSAAGVKQRRRRRLPGT